MAQSTVCTVWQSCLLLFCLFTAWSCQDPTAIGGELLNEDLEVEELNITDLTARIELQDSVRTFHPNPSLQLGKYWFGKYDDPLFGTVTSEVYAQPRLPRASNVVGFIHPRFQDSLQVLDSIILILPYADPDDGVVSYGDTNSVYEMEVRSVIDEMDNTQTYYSNQTFAGNLGAVTTHSFTPRRADKNLIYYTNGQRDTLIASYERIPLSLMFGQGLVNRDSLTFASDSMWLDFLKGLRLQPTNTSGGLVAFNLIDNNFGGLYVHFRTVTGRPASYQFPFNSNAVRLAHYEHDLTGSVLGDLLSSPRTQDTIMYVQGWEGARTRIILNDLSALNNVIVNKAELIATVVPDGQTGLYPLPERVTLSAAEDGSEEPLLIVDARRPNLEQIDAFFGGVREVVASGATQYRMNITQHLQRIIEGTATNELFLQAFPRAEDPSRVRFYGPDHPEHPLRIRVIYTRIDQ